MSGWGFTEVLAALGGTAGVGAGVKWVVARVEKMRADGLAEAIAALEAQDAKIARLKAELRIEREAGRHMREGIPGVAVELWRDRDTPVWRNDFAERLTDLQRERAAAIGLDGAAREIEVLDRFGDSLPPEHWPLSLALAGQWPPAVELIVNGEPVRVYAYPLGIEKDDAGEISRVAAVLLIYWRVELGTGRVPPPTPSHLGLVELHASEASLSEASSSADTVPIYPEFSGPPTEADSD